MSFFGLLFLAFLIWFVVVPLLRIVMRAREMRRQWQSMFQGGAQPGSGQRRQPPRPQPRPRKRWGKDVGEYVDFVDLPPEPARPPHAAPADLPPEPRVEDADWEDIR